MQAMILWYFKMNIIPISYHIWYFILCVKSVPAMYMACPRLIYGVSTHHRLHDKLHWIQQVVFYFLQIYIYQPDDFVNISMHDLLISWTSCFWCLSYVFFAYHFIDVVPFSGVVFAVSLVVSCLGYFLPVFCNKISL